MARESLDDLLARLKEEKELKKGFYVELALVGGNVSNPRIKADIQELIDYSHDNPHDRSVHEIIAIEERLYAAMPALKRIEAKYTGLEANIGVDPAIKSVGQKQHGAIVSLLDWFAGKKKK